MMRRKQVLLTEKTERLIPGIKEVLTTSGTSMNQTEMSCALGCANDFDLLKALEWLRSEHILEYDIRPLPCEDDLSVRYKFRK